MFECLSGWQRTVHARARGRGAAGRDPVGREDCHGALGAHGLAVALVATEEQQEGHVAVLLEEVQEELVLCKSIDMVSNGHKVLNVY